MPWGSCLEPSHVNATDKMNDLFAKEGALDREMFHPPWDATLYHASASSTYR